MLASGMTSAPDLPPGGPSPRREQRAAAPLRTRSAEPARYVAWLLLWQGMTWLALAGAGLWLWLVTLPAALGSGSTNGTVLWTGAQLLAIAVGACLGAAEVGMACKLQGVTLAAGLVVVAIAVMIAGSVLELLALNGAL
jgi:hypothetical protein